MATVAAGDLYVAHAFGEMRIFVLRVAPNNSWADICVAQHHGGYWTKRQPLQDGCFPYDVEGVS